MVDDIPIVEEAIVNDLVPNLNANPMLIEEEEIKVPVRNQLRSHRRKQLLMKFLY